MLSSVFLLKKVFCEAEKYLVNICSNIFRVHCWMVSISIWLWYYIETSLHADAPFQYPRKSSENLRYFQGVENGTLLFAGGIKRKHWLVMDWHWWQLKLKLWHFVTVIMLKQQLHIRFIPHRILFQIFKGIKSFVSSQS